MISKTAEYALRAVVCLAGDPNHESLSIPAEILAEKTQVPRRYLHRVLQGLASHSIVRSRPGPGGGYELARDSATLTILDIINSVDPIQRIVSCPLGLASHTELCPLHAEIDKAYAQTEAAFQRVTIKMLIESTSPIVPLCEMSRDKLQGK